MKNAGKKFEQLWKQSAEKQDLFILRLNDTDMSFNQNKELRSRFTLKSPCDFIMFYDEYLIILIVILLNLFHLKSENSFEKLSKKS